jgi:hypothetical protein
MDNVINLEAAADLDRKYFLAFLKGLAQIKYKDLITKLKIKEGEALDAQMDLEFLYNNLFDPEQFSADKFNQLVENGMHVIADLLEMNMSRDALEEYLNRKINAREETRKVIAQFWKQESVSLL